MQNVTRSMPTGIFGPFFWGHKMNGYEFLVLICMMQPVTVMLTEFFTAMVFIVLCPFFAGSWKICSKSKFIVQNFHVLS